MFGPNYFVVSICILYYILFWPILPYTNTYYIHTYTDTVNLCLIQTRIIYFIILRVHKLFKWTPFSIQNYYLYKVNCLYYFIDLLIDCEHLIGLLLCSGVF